jgi:D-alanine-D-alanine ligase-like ATP-grasp enzyme
VNDSRIISKLKEMNLSKRSILKKDQKVFLLDNANLSTGGEAIDCTHEIHKSFRNLAVSATKDMGLRLCGVDILTKDITLPCKEYVILELNAAPGLDNYASIGKEQRDRVDNLYLEILKLLEKSSK